jgi:hypothetical protein
MADARVNHSLRRADRAWQNEGWVPSVAVFILTILAIALLGSRTQTPADGIANLSPAESAGAIASALGRQALDALADAGLFFAPSAPWLIESLIALVVAVVAVPALRDLAARSASDEASPVAELAREVLELQDDAHAISLRKDVPGLALDQTLRRFAGIVSQAIAVLAGVMWTTTLAAMVRVWVGWAPSDPILNQAIGVLFAAPFVVAIAAVTSLYRITPDRARLRRLVAMLLDERATRARASSYTPTYPARTAAWLRWGTRVGGPLLLTVAWMIGLIVPPLTAGSTWDEVLGSPGSFAGAFLLALLIVAIVWIFFDALASGLVMARFWIGGRAGLVLIVICALLLFGLVISFAVVVIAPTVADQDWLSFAIYTALLLVPTAGMGLPVAIKWRRSLRFIPGYAQLPAIELARDRLITTYTDEIATRLAPIPRVPKRSRWDRLLNRAPEQRAKPCEHRAADRR